MELALKENCAMTAITDLPGALRRGFCDQLGNFKAWLNIDKIFCFVFSLDLPYLYSKHQ